jgi:hypothetical protein
MKRARYWCLVPLLCCLSFLADAAPGARLIKIAATEKNLLFTVEAGPAPLSLVELAPYQNASAATNATPLLTLSKKGRSKVSLPRFEGGRDRIYSGFIALENGAPLGPMRFVEDWNESSRNHDSYPRLKSKKGLQVQMVEDALALGVKHAAFNFNISSSVSLVPASGDFPWQMDGRTFHFRRGSIEHLDRSIKPLSDAGAAVTLILLNYEGGGADLSQVLLHPNYDKSCPQHLSAFNTSTPEGLAWFKAWVEFLADRYTAPKSPHGRVVNFIIGNEVNSHWQWANMGHVSMPQFAQDYLRTVRVAHTAVRKFSSSARVFLSLEHHWNIRYPADDATQCFAGRPFLDFFNQEAKAGGDFDWHLAFHPYPENLFECRTWNDKSATRSHDTPRITFKNIDLLPRYLRQPELLFQGEARHIILSEQGFHSNATPEGELAQAAAYCYAYYKVAHLEGIDSFILHRHVDNAAEGGLNLGLWRRAPASIADPLSQKPIYQAFRFADTDQWEKAFQFALPVIGIQSWKEVLSEMR